VQFTVTPAPPADINPAITSFSPASGVPGTTVMITGVNLAGTMGVSVNGTPARSFTVLSPTAISFVVDTGSISGAILVDAPAGIALSGTDFSVIAPVPSIGSFTPASGMIGTKVVLTGSNFGQVSAVTVGGVKAVSFVVNSATRLTLVVSGGTRSGRIQVRTLGGLATSVSSFTFMRAPKIGSFSPARGKTGTKVVVTGSNFSQVSAVTVGGVRAASYVVNSPTRLTVCIGGTTRTGRIQVRTRGGLATSTTAFTFTPAPQITSFSPSSGVRGTKVVIAGAHFTGASAVTVSGIRVRFFVVNSPIRISFVLGGPTHFNTVEVTTPGGSAIRSTNTLMKRTV
jgi:hypothetical protein